jgi:hypothetical protein
LGDPRRAGFETAEWTSVDPVVSLAMLEQVVTGRDALAWIKSGFPDSTTAGSQADERWVFRVYDHHRAVREAIGDDQIEGVARPRAGMEELSDWDPRDVEVVRRDLVRLARTARLSSQALHCWLSL